MKIRRGDPKDPSATALLRASHEVMTSLFPAESNNYLSIEELCVPDVRFFLADVGGDAVGCGAIADREGYGELKSMFVAEKARGSGVADALVEHLEADARHAGHGLIRLETGTLLHAALNLYSRHGYKFRTRFGDYIETPYSLYMETSL